MEKIMNEFILRLFFTVLALMSLLSSSLQAAGLDENLYLLEPLIGVDWVGGYIGSEAPDLEISLRFEQILNGKAVRYTRVAAAADFTSETHFYWNPASGEICFISLNSRGVVGEGTVLSEESGIVLSGSNHWPDRTTETRTILEIDSDGSLQDTFTRKEDGEWVQGHLQHFRAVE